MKDRQRGCGNRRNAMLLIITACLSISTYITLFEFVDRRNNPLKGTNLLKKIMGPRRFGNIMNFFN